MSIPINTDNSVQLSYSSFPFTITNVDNYASSNFILSLSSNNSNYTLNASNALKANIDLKQNTLTASTNLLGIGTAITAIDYNKISVNKPTNFQADWLTTIINKPSTFPADMTVIYNKTETNNLITNSSNYTLNASNALRSSINNIYTKTETNNLITNSSNYTLNASNALQTNINSTNNNFANYLPKSGGTISGLLTTGNITISGTTGRLNVMDDYHYIEFSQATDTTTICEYGKVVFLIGPTRTERAKINASGLTATAFYGDGANITNIPYSTITGKPTNFQADWLTTIINKPSTFTADMTNIYTKIETNNLLGNKQDTLTAATNLLGNGSAITNIAYTNITGKPTNFQADWLTTIINKPSTFPADMTNIYTKIETNNLLGNKQDTLTAATNLLGNGSAITNIAYANITGKPTNFQADWLSTVINKPSTFTPDMTNIYTKTETDGRYLQLSGGTMTGQLQILASTYNGLYMTNTNSNDIVSIELRNNTTYSSFIGIGCTAYTGNYKNNLFIQSPQSLILNTNGNATSATPNFIINTSGNVGIGTTNPTEDLHIYGNDNAFIKVDSVGGTGQSGLRLFAGSGTTNRATRIDFFNNVASTTSARWSMLSDTDQNGTNDFRIYNAGGIANVLTLLQNGNIGIGIKNPSCKLSLGSSSGYKVLSLWDNGLNNDFQFNGFGANGGLCFNIYNNTTDSFQFRAGASTTAANEVMRIYGNGSVCIGTASATSTNTKLTISGASYGYPEPLVNIIQTRGWDGNYALQVSGYTNLGGIRINGGDLGNSIYKTDAGTMGFSTTSGAIYIFVNGVEKAKFDTNGTTNISGVLTVPNITIGNGGKINTVDDYHYIQISQSTDTLTIQEYGTISFNIGQTKTQRAYINSGGLGVNGSLNVSGLTRHTQLFNYGETVSYQTGFNATPSANGWFWMTNSFWSGYNTPSYLIITVMANGNGAVWYGRAFLKQGGGCWTVICDFRSPNGAANTISVDDFWGSNGANALMISIQNPVYAGTFNIKISG